jgi:SAM-dependent methyltransferase
MDLQEWWEAKHKEDSKRYLSGSTLEQYCSFLKIQPILKKAETVLEIGCGLGIATEELYQTRKDIHVLDISHRALNRVAKIANTWHMFFMNQMPKNYFDIAISYLVAQHMNDEALYDQLENVIRCLKKTGILAIQFAQLKHPQKPSVKIQQFGGISRSPLNMKLIIEEAGGSIIKILESKDFKRGLITWHGFHVSRSA